MSLIIKLVVVGHYNGGKTSLIRRYVRNTFEVNIKSTIGIDLLTKKSIVDGKEIDIQIWDTAGVERFLSVVPLCYKKAHGVIIVFDMTDRDSFADVDKMYTKFRESAQHPDLPVFIVANKSDKQTSRKVSTEEAQEKANELHAIYWETSAKSDHNCQEMFNDIIHTCLTNNLAEIKENDDPNEVLDKKDESNKIVLRKRRRSKIANELTENNLDLEKQEQIESMACGCFR